MQDLAYVFDGTSLHRVVLTDNQLQCRAVSSPMERVSSVTYFGHGTFYYIRFDSQNVLRRWGPSNDSAEYKLPGPANAVFTYRCRIYCCAGENLYTFDPLNEGVEVLPLHHNAVNIQPVGHGFVFVDEYNELYAFHFNEGVTKVTLEEKVQLLGHENFWAVVHFGENQTVFVNENGEVHQGTLGFEVFTPFISLDNAVLVSLGDGKLSLQKKKSIKTTLVDRARCLELIPIPQLEPADSCPICLCEFEEKDGVTLDCGHCFHLDCLIAFSKLADSFIAKGEHVVFTNAVCPGGCGSLIRHPAAPHSALVASLKIMIRKKAQNILCVTPNKTIEDLLFYICHRCEKPFYGGEKWCARMRSGEPPKKPSELICSDCNEDFSCDIHHHQFVLYKCRYCCNLATQLSFGNRYMCEGCHERWETTEPGPLPCPGADKCAVKGIHCTDGSYPLGCMLCMPPDFFVNLLSFSTSTQ